MTIFTLPGWYKSKNYPENSIFIYEQMQAIRELGHDIVVLSVQPVSIKEGRKTNKEITKINDNGILTYYTEVYALQPSRFKSLYVQSFQKALIRLVNEAVAENGKPDFFYAHFTFPAGFAALKISREWNIPLIVEEHYSGLMRKNLDKTLERYIKETVDKSQAFICVSDGLRSVVNRITGDSKAIVVSNMIDPCFTFHPLPIERKPFTFFSMGSLIYRKGFDLLIKAFSEEFRDDNTVVLRIAGSGSERSNLVKIIEECGCTSRIRLIGQLNRNDTLNEYINCHCFVLPSRAETYGLVYREAMAVGRPIISTKHGGFNEVEWDKKCGYLVDIDDLAKLKAAMRSIYENYASYNGKYISAECLKECSSSNIAKKIIDVFKAVQN